MKELILNSTPKADGYHMPGEFEPQDRVWMLWPERPDNWRDEARPAQQAFAEVAKAIARFEPVVVGASPAQLSRARAMLPETVRVVELESNDAWMRDVGPSFLVDGKGGLRGVDWTFNAWGGNYDGLYTDWSKDDQVAQKVCRMEGVPRYRTEGFVLEDGIDPKETNGHIDDVACFVRPGEVACIWTEDKGHPFYQAAHAAYEALCQATDARGRRLRVHKICLPRELVRLSGSETILPTPGSAPRRDGDLCIASYLNFLIVNGGVIVPQYGDEYDARALSQVQRLFPERRAVGVSTREVVFGGGNIHCITQQVPRAVR